MRNNYADLRWSAPRLLGVSALVLGAVVLCLMVFASRAEAAADLALTKSDSPDPVVSGNNLTYTILVTNGGTTPATNVVVTDTLPSGVDFVSATGSQGTPCTRTGDVVTCNLGTIANGGSATVTIVVQAKKTGTISNTAVVGATPGEETNTANNADTEQTTVLNKGQGQGGKKGQASCAAPTITGTAGNDVITGTSRADVISTFGGDDQVFALGGRDLVCTGAGFDLVKGGAKGDTVIGGADADRLIGNKGGDLLKGKAGPDKLRGKGGNDTLNGGSGRDKCKGGAGTDVLKRCP
jgi:uncharacterized repeat protein (TIGR01451 family)